MTLIKRYPVVAFFVLTFVISWALFLPGIAVSQGWLGQDWDWARSLSVAGNFGPSLAGLLLTRLLYGHEGLRDLRVRLQRRGVPNWWLAVALLLPIGVNLAALGLGYILPDSAFAAAEYPWFAFPLVFAVVFLTAGIAEEIGWRGFALPHLQRYRDALVSSVILGVVWALWHLPAWWLADNVHQDLNFPVFMLGTVGFSIVLTWLSNSTRSSLFLPILMHTAMNASRGVITSATVGIVPLHVVIIWLVAVVIIVRTNPQRLARHV
jgi:membrane protease YdiL (CAAX protease family)